jgi:hypothetical protein
MVQIFESIHPEENTPVHTVVLTGRCRLVFFDYWSVSTGRFRLVGFDKTKKIVEIKKYIKRSLSYSHFRSIIMDAVKLEKYCDNQVEEDEETIEYMVEPMANPWAVASLSKFQFYNCPECDFKAKHEGTFYTHAIESHSQANECWSEWLHLSVSTLRHSKNYSKTTSQWVISPSKSPKKIIF